MAGFRENDTIPPIRCVKDASLRTLYTCRSVTDHARSVTINKTQSDESDLKTLRVSVAKQSEQFLGISSEREPSKHISVTPSLREIKSGEILSNDISETFREAPFVKEPPSYRNATSQTSQFSMNESKVELYGVGEPSAAIRKEAASTNSKVRRAEEYYANEDEDNRPWKKAITILKWGGKLCYIMCPPLPNFVIRKAAFHPPKRCFYYFLIGGEEEKRKLIDNAKKALKSKDLVICLPHLLEPSFKGSNIIDQMMRVKIELVPTEKGECLMGVHVFCEKSIRLAQPSPFVILFAQPNSSDIGACLLTDPNLVDIADFLECDLIAFDYSGFGISTGKCSEKNVYDNIETVFRFFKKQIFLEPYETILMGFSMGTAAVIHLASKQPTQQQFAGVVLIAPFTSLLRVVSGKPECAETCCLDQFASVDKVAQVKARTLICHGRNDGIVPISHGITLQRMLPNATQPCWVNNATHQGIYCEREMWDHVQDFLFNEIGVLKAWREIVS